MKLDSTESLSIAGGKINDGQTCNSVSEEKKCPNESDWCYMFVHHTKVEQTSAIMREKFNVFVHRTTTFVKNRAKVVKQEKPTISGLMFIQGEPNDITKFLHEVLPDRFLANDCATGKTARIKDAEMQFFIKATQIEPTRIHIMEKPYEYYGKLHPRVLITSGPFAGKEGVILRIHRDRKFIIRIGNLTIAISGAHKETYIETDQSN